MRKNFIVLVILVFSICACDIKSDTDTAPESDKEFQQKSCDVILKALGDRWRCDETAAMDFMLTPPDIWPENEKERRKSILEVAGRLSSVFAGKAFGVSVEFGGEGREKVKAEFLPENGRALSEYSAFGLSWQDADEFDLLEEEQRIELEDGPDGSRLKHYVRLLNRSGATIKNLKTRSCIAFEDNIEHCVDNLQGEDLEPEKTVFWSLDMGQMKSPDVRAWYEATSEDKKRVMAYQQYPNNLHKAWAALLRNRGELFQSWDGRGENPQRMIKSRWIASEKFKSLDAAGRKAGAAELYGRIHKTLEAFLDAERLKKEMNVAVVDNEERLLLNYAPEAVN